MLEKERSKMINCKCQNSYKCNTTLSLDNIDFAAVLTVDDNQSDYVRRRSVSIYLDANGLVELIRRCQSELQKIAKWTGYRNGFVRQEMVDILDEMEAALLNKEDADLP